MASLLEVEDLHIDFPVKGGLLRRTVDHVAAVDGVSIRLEPGHTLGLVGESGSGKSTLGRAIVGLQRPTSGRITLDGINVDGSSRARRDMSRVVQMVFQDPYASLNPRLTVEQIISVAWKIQRIRQPKGYRTAARELLERVGLNPSFADRYPHQFSGGQRQRIGIARALALQPRLIVCDEAVSALDVSVRAQIINLLEDVQQDYGVAYLFIAHDLSVVQRLCPTVAVMHRGRVVEHGATESIYADPQKAYTRALLDAVPVTYPWRTAT